MKKYLTLFSQRLSEYSTYRMRLFVTILQGFITPLFLLLVLSLATPTGGTSVSGLISYFLLVGLIYPLTRSRVNEFIEEQTTSGEINNLNGKVAQLSEQVKSAESLKNQLAETKAQLEKLNINELYGLIKIGDKTKAYKIGDMNKMPPVIAFYIIQLV